MTDRSKPILYGADYSVYVRIARMALEEKGVGYNLMPVDVFAEGGPPDWYLERHPFARIPAFEHDGFRLFETGAITRYVDEAFQGPSLQPADARRRAVMNQIIGLVDAYAYRAMVWDVAVERLEGNPPDEKRIAAGLGVARTTLTVLSDLKMPGDWLLGDMVSLADLHLAPVIGYFLNVEEGRDLLATVPAIAQWWDTVSIRSSFVGTTRAS
jgi:glutathione S-transferase